MHSYPKLVIFHALEAWPTRFLKAPLSQKSFLMVMECFA